MKKIWRVGLAFDIQWDYCEDVIRGVNEYNRQRGPFHFMLDRGGEFDFRTASERKDIDGIILHRFFGDNSPGAANYRARVPVVSVEGEESQITPWQVLPDDKAVGEMVAEEFLERAFKHFAYCTYYTESGNEQQRRQWDQKRMNGFLAAVSAVCPTPSVYETADSEWGQCQSDRTGPLAQWLLTLPKPVGIMAATDRRASHVVLAAEANGISVPDEVAVIGVNNEKWTEGGARGISSVELDGFRAGYVAMEMLHKRMEGQDIPPETIRIPPRRLITRQSSDIMVSNDPDVALALQFISKHAAAGISVNDVVDAVALSRRSLEHRFQASLNRSIMDIIRTVQIQRSKRLLGDEDMPLPRVAKSSGFTSAKSLREIFHRMTGMTPSAYRSAMQQSSNAPTDGDGDEAVVRQGPRLGRML
jgi:LacI family transcriptional regulator